MAGAGAHDAVARALELARARTELGAFWSRSAARALTRGERAAGEPGRFPQDILSAVDRARGIDAAHVRSVRDELKRARTALERRLGRFSALLSPTVPTGVPTVEAENVATSTRFTRIFSALGWPAASVPCGQDDDGRPVGMHVASTHGLPAVLAVAAMIERGQLAAPSR